MGLRRVRSLAPVAGVLAVVLVVSPAVAQEQAWSLPPAPSPPPPPPPPPPEGGGVALQILAGIGIGAAAVGAMVLADQSDQGTAEGVIWGLAGVTPAAVGLAICSLGRQSARSEPSCPRAVVAAYIGSLIAIPVLLVTFLLLLDWGPQEPGSSNDDNDELLISGATGLAWVAGMTAGATIFGRRRLRPPVVGAGPPTPPPPASFAPSDDPRLPRWSGARFGNPLVFRLLSVEF